MIERWLIAIVDGCLEVFGQYSAKVILPMPSLERVHVAPAHVAQPFATVGEPLLKRLPNGAISVKHNIASQAGLLIWVMAIASFFKIKSFLI